MADLVTLANVKSYLWPGESITTWDAILPSIISAVSETVKREVGCDITYTFYPALPGTSPMFVVDSTNNKIDFDEGAADLVGTVASGSYIGAALATAVAAAMNAAPGRTAAYSCVYDATAGKFTISVTASVTLQWSSGANKNVSIAWLLGFIDTVDVIGTAFVSEKTSVAARIRGDGTSALALPNWPIVAVMSVVDEDGTTYTEGYDQDYIIENLCLRKVGLGVWSPKEYFVFYQAGYATIPADIALICYELIARKWKTMKEQGWGESGRTMPDGSTSTVNADGALTKSQREILARYKRPIL
jgi:hypothetical protein